MAKPGKVSITELIRIHRANVKEGRGEETRIAQIAGEIYRATGNSDLAAKISPEIDRVITENYRRGLRQNRRAIHDLLVWKYSRYVYSTQK